jgi:hypothetical protein
MLFDSERVATWFLKYIHGKHYRPHLPAHKDQLQCLIETLENVGNRCYASGVEEAAKVSEEAESSYKDELETLLSLGHDQAARFAIGARSAALAITKDIRNITGERGN